MKKHLQKISAILLLLPATAFAQMDLEQVIKPEAGKPINIKSDNMIIRNKENLAIFTDNVNVKQGAMTLKSDQLKVYSDYDEKTKKNKFKRMEAEGNVDFNSQDKSVQSNSAVYDVIAGTLVLTGNVHMKDADTSLEGKIFKYDVKTGRSEIRNTGPGTGVPAATASTSSSSSGADQPVSSGGRARAIFTPGEDVKNFSTPMESLTKVKNPSGEKKSDEPEEKKLFVPPPRAY